MNEPKMVIIVRKDLKCRTGKWIAQGGHAGLAFIRTKIVKEDKDGNDGYMNWSFCLSKTQRDWLFGIQKKICLCVNSLEELMDLLVKARANNLESHLIQDLGLTEVEPDTYTALVIGPDLPNRIDKITSHLKLY